MVRKSLAMSGFRTCYMAWILTAKLSPGTATTLQSETTVSWPAPISLQSWPNKRDCNAPLHKIHCGKNCVQKCKALPACLWWQLGSAANNVSPRHLGWQTLFPCNNSIFATHIFCQLSPASVLNAFSSLNNSSTNVLASRRKKFSCFFWKQKSDHLLAHIYAK